MMYLQPLSGEEHPSNITKTPLHRTSSSCSNLTDDTVETDMEKFVGFNLVPTVRETISRHEYSPDELKSCWFTSEECKETEIDIAKELKLMEKGKKLKDKKYSSRGLENFTPLKALARNDTMDSAIISVMLEQESQRATGERDEVAIAEAYHRISHSCHLWAAVVGTRDRLDAEKYLDEDIADEIDIMSSSIRTNYDDNSMRRRSSLSTSNRSNSCRPSSSNSTHSRNSLLDISQRYDFMSSDDDKSLDMSERKEAPVRRIITPRNSMSFKSNAMVARSA